MSNTQFYFALGVPFFTVVLMYVVGALSNRSAINDVSKHIDDVSKRIDDLRSDMRAGFSDLGSRMDRIEHRLGTIDTEIRVDHAHLEARVLGDKGDVPPVTSAFPYRTGPCLCYSDNPEDYASARNLH